MSDQGTTNCQKIPPQPPSDHWGGALVVACLALGFVTSWGAYEVHQRVAQEAGARDARDNMNLIVSQQSDLGRLMADPTTKLINLIPAATGSPVRLASVAWNQQSQRGALFCEDLADGSGKRYQIWLVPQSGSATTVLVGPIEPGRAVFMFSPVRAATEPSEMVLTAEQTGAMPDHVLARGRIVE
jgi:hypothetical protein